MNSYAFYILTNNLFRFFFFVCEVMVVRSDYQSFLYFYWNIIKIYINWFEVSIRVENYFVNLYFIVDYENASKHSSDSTKCL